MKSPDRIKWFNIALQLTLATIMLVFAFTVATLPWISTMVAGWCFGLAYAAWLDK